MITITCDMCGEELNKITNEVSLQLTYEGLQILGTFAFRSKEKNLCISCATRLLNWIDNQLEKKRGDND